MHWSAASSLPAFATVAAAAGCVESVPTAVSSASSMGERFGRGGVGAPRREMRASRRSHPLLRLGMVVVSRCSCATAEARSWEQQLRKTIKAAACVRHSRFSRLGGEKTAGPARGRPVQNVPVRGARRQGRPAHRAAPPARGCRGRQQRHVARGKPGKWPGRRSSAARAGGLVVPVNRRCSSRGAFAQHGSQVPAVPPQGVKCRTRCMQSTNPPSVLIKQSNTVGSRPNPSRSS